MAKRDVKKCRECGKLKVRYSKSQIKNGMRYVSYQWQCNRCHYHKRIIREVKKESGRKTLSGLLQ